MHPFLTPGTHVLLRGPEEVQVGLDPERSVVVPGRAPVLTALAGTPELLATLVRSGLAETDDHALRRALPGHEAGVPWVRHTLSAVARRVRSALPEVLEGRGSRVVTVTPFGHPMGRELAEELTGLCLRTGLRLPSRPRPGPAPRRARRLSPVHVLIGVGEPTRDLLDGWVREGVPHLVVRLVEGRAVIGPFVVPGKTACLRCIDAYRAEEDPAWPLLVEQYARATRSDRADGIPEPVDAALAAVAVGWAARELASYAENAVPVSWSSTTRLSATLDTVETRHWPQHPHCGCTWP